MLENTNGSRASKIIKSVLKILAAVIAVVLILAIVALFFVDHLTKSTVQDALSAVTGVPCKIGRIAIHPFSAQISMKKLVLGNPPEYDSEYSIALENVTLILDPSTVFNRKIIIEEIRLKDVSINYETTPLLTSSNVLDIITHLNKSAEDEKIMLDDPSGQDEFRSPIQPRFQLNRMVVQDVRLWVTSNGFSTKAPLAVPLPETDPFGMAGDGLTPLGLLNETATGMYVSIYNFAMASKTQIISNFFKSSQSGK